MPQEQVLYIRRRLHLLRQMLKQRFTEKTDMEITDGVFRSTYTTPTFVQPVHGSTVSNAGDTLLELYSPNGRFTVSLGDLQFPSATKVVIKGGLPLLYTGCPTCQADYHYTKVYAVYETYTQKPSEMPVSINLLIDGVSYEAKNGTLKKVI